MIRFYGRMMQHVLLPAMLAPTRSRATRLTRLIRQRQRWPRERLAACQLERLRQLVELAARESPFYRDRFRQFGLNADSIRSLDDLRHFPITSKGELEANFPDGMVVGSQRSGDWQYVGTRGTTRRVMVVHDFQRRDHERAGILLALTEDSPYYYGDPQVSIPPDACSVHCGVESDRASSVSGQLLSLLTRRIEWNRNSVSDLRGLVMDNWVKRTVLLPPLSLDGSDESVRACVQAIREARPVQLIALPEYLRDVSEYILRSNDAPPPIPIVRPMGANLPHSWKRQIADGFRGTVREHYGSREMSAMAFDCAETDGLHVMMDQHLIEVERNGESVRDGELGRVLVTDLNNFAMPIIRYDIGDLARISREPCICGRTTPRLFMEGRIQDAFVLADGRVLTAEAVANHFAGQAGVRDFELSESGGGKWTLRLVPYPDADLNPQAIAEAFAAWCGESRPVNVRLTDVIRPEASGKYRHCKSRSFQQLEASGEPRAARKNEQPSG